jgi:hypothetical protein
LRVNAPAMKRKINEKRSKIKERIPEGKDKIGGR